MPYGAPLLMIPPADFRS